MAFPLLASLAGPVLTGLFSARGARKQKQFDAKQAQKQMDFQERMSSTAHQREVADLRAAGLNPILSATGGSGASAPAGALSRSPNILGEGVSSAISAMRLKQELRNMKATERVTISQEGVNSAREALTRAQTGIISIPAQVGEYGGSFIPRVISWLESSAKSVRDNFMRVISYDRSGDQRARDKRGAVQLTIRGSSGSSPERRR